MSTATAPGSTRSLARPGRTNLSTAELYELALRDGEGLLAANGPLVVRTGRAHRPLAEGQVHRRRAVVRGEGLVGRREPPDLRGALRPPSGAPREVPRRSRPVQPGHVHRRAPDASPVAPRLHRDGLGEHLRPQPLPAPAQRGARRLRPELHDHRRAVVRGGPGDRGHPDRARRSSSTSSGWR